MKENFSELIEYLDEKFDKVDSDFKELKENFNLLQKSVDAKTDKDTTASQETTMLTGKVQRHEKWITQIAKKVDLKLES